LTKELPSKNILGKKYAKFIHHGSYESIEKTYHNIYTHWILEDNIEFDSSPIIEHYMKHDGNTKNENDFITYILIPIL
jgi:predicted transcriptional regulator YdeE